MKLLSLASLAVLLLQAPLNPLQQPRPQASIEGTVTRLGSGQTVPAARVTLTHRVARQPGARLGDADVLNGPFRFSGRDAQPLDVLISSSVGAIDGIAADTAGQPIAGAQVVLIPSRNRERTELFRPVTSDSSGRFIIPAIAPGDYVLAAWDAIEPYAFFDPALIRQAEENGKAIRVLESSGQAVNLTPMMGK